MTMKMMATSRWAFLALLWLLPEVCHSQYDEIAATFGTTVEEVLSLGGIPDANCTFAFNATRENCDDLIGRYEDENPDAEECDCYNFCGGKNTGCFPLGETPQLFQCNIFDVVAGCQKNTESKVSPLNLNKGKEEPCPSGYMCSKDKMKKCDDIRQIPIDLGLGDIHAGMYCPGRGDRQDNGYQVCESGHYCPNSTTMIPCPAGLYCPWKTAFPDIKCPQCKEGARTLERQPYGYIVGGIVFGILVILFFLSLFKQYNADAFEKLQELRGRNMDKVRAKMQSAKRQEKLKALQPKLQVVEARLKQNSPRLQVDPKESIRAINTQTESGKIKFDARKMFELMDTNGDGVLSYDEIHAALELKPIQQREFTRRMNQMAKLPPETETISRQVFSNYFLRVLEQTSHFEPTANEASLLFDEILESIGIDDSDSITHESLFDSPLADFLTEKQINHLIKRFRNLQEKHRNIVGGDDDSNPTEWALRVGEVESNRRPKIAKRNSFNTFHWGARMGDDSNQGNSVRRRRSTTIIASRPTHRASFHRENSEGETPYNPFKFKRPSIITYLQKFERISRQEFIAWYPPLLMEVTGEDREISDLRRHVRGLGGVDIAFENLSLTVTVKNNAVKIVDKVSGRIRAGTMTALMGGSGAGKTSLLNALCGRAFYGDVTGTVKINGHKASIEEHSHVVGFVPQDDIVYAELTVRENFVFSGKFQLPKGTPMQEIEDLADETMANLGLSRVMHSIVGDVSRRGVSGGEKKRVNIGLELMARPRILFLDEPTSGLDANSALLVMESLETLVKTQGTTVCSVIHQPRKFIYELFDSIILLGVGGQMVYHGPTVEAEQYFNNIGYILPAGESIADWLIDISSGRLGPTQNDKDSGRFIPYLKPTAEEDSFALDPSLSQNNEVSTDGSAAMDLPVESTQQTGGIPDKEGSAKLLVENMNVKEGSASSFDYYGSQSMLTSMQDLVRSTLGENGFDIIQDEASKAKARREVLYDKWRAHFKNLPDDRRVDYEAPEPYDLPARVEKATFGKQLWYQIQRCIIVGERNWMSKVIDTTIILIAVVLVAALDGTEQVTFHTSYRDLNYDKIAEPSTVRDLVSEFPKLFSYSFTANLANLQGYGAKLGVLLAVLISLTAGKTITSKRKEFFRESANGYNVNAYFGAVNIIGTVEHSLQCIISCLASVWLRNPLSSWSSFFVCFLLVGWLSVSWAYLFPLLVPLDNVVMVTGFYMVVFSLMFSGNIAPIVYTKIYETDGMSIFCGLLSPTRWFIEAMAVVESRCLPVQSGFTEYGVNFKGEITRAGTFSMLGLAQKDLGTVTVRSFDGWYWGALPAFAVGMTIRWLTAGVIHVSDRPKQAKKPFYKIMDARLAITMMGYIVILFGLLAVSIYLILRETSSI